MSIMWELNISNEFWFSGVTVVSLDSYYGILFYVKSSVLFIGGVDLCSCIIFIPPRVAY